jgi:predicted MFS family arabinose efflux permease
MPAADVVHHRPPPTGRLLTASLVARVGELTIGLPLVLLVVRATGSYAVAGLTTGGLAAGMAVATPVLGRAADRRGHRPVLGWAAAVSATVLVVLALTAHALPAPAIVLLAVVAGLSAPPLEASVRSIFVRTEHGPRLQRAMTMDSTGQELVFIGAPPLLVGVSALASPAAAVVLAALLTLAGTGAMLLLPQTGLPPRERPAVARGALRAPGMGVLLAIAVLLGAGWGLEQLAVIAQADAQGRDWLAAAFIAAWAAGSLVGGLAAIARPWDAPAPRRMALLLAAGALLAVPPALVAGTPVALTCALFLQGVTLAPAVAAHAEVVAAAAPGEVVTEAYAWISSMIVVGVAVGEVSGGLLIDARGPVAALAVGAGFAAAAALVAAAPAWRRPAGARRP